MRVHLHITTTGCDHITFVVHRSSDDILLGKFIVSRSALEEELSEYESALDRLKAQIIGLALENKGKTKAQLKAALETAVFNV